MQTSAKRELALDTNVLLDLAAGCDWSLDFLEVFQDRGYSFVATSTVLFELNDIRKNGAANEKSLVLTALQSFENWNCRALPISSSDFERCQKFRIRISRLQLLPDKEWNDGLLLAETALAKIPILVTSDRHLLNIDTDQLLVALIEENLPLVHAVHPKRLTRALR